MLSESILQNIYVPPPSKAPNSLIKSVGYKYQNIAINNDYIWDVAWIYTPETIAETIANYIRGYNGLITALIALPPEEKTFINTFVLIDDYVLRNHFDINRVVFLQQVSEEKAIRDASIEAEKKLNEFLIGMDMRVDLYELAQTIYNKEGKILQGEDLLYLKDKLTQFKRNGLNLEESIRDKIKKLSQDLTILCTDFSVNIANDKTTIQFTKEELDGLPDSFFSGLEVNDVGLFTLTMKYPDVFPVFEKANNEETRRKMDLAYNSRCKENILVLFKILKIRQHLANILGYNTWADYILELNMAKTEPKVKSFLSNLVDKLTPLRKKELDYMKSQNGAKEIQPYDWIYYSELEKIQKYNIDSEVVREYFPLNNVLTHMFGYFERLLGFRFIRGLKDSWHKNAWEWLVYDKTENRIIGKFYLDIFPRDNKFTHAACFPLKYATYADPYSVCAMVCNFPSDSVDMPSLLSHSDVETLYHEFGHVMHNICACTYYVVYSGTQTDRDFLEAPSQLLENWCWEPNTLKELSKHYKTGESMPDDMIEKIIATRYVTSGITNSKQLVLAITDQLLHTESLDNEDHIEKIYNQVSQEIMGIQNQPDTCRLAIFDHITGGYDAQYYSYMWSKIYADDMYEKLKELLIKDPMAGLEYRRQILAWGGSRDVTISLRNFLGRDPDPAAFLRNLGLDEKNK